MTAKKECIVIKSQLFNTEEEWLDCELIKELEKKGEFYECPDCKRKTDKCIEVNTVSRLVDMAFAKALKEVFRLLSELRKRFKGQYGHKTMLINFIIKKIKELSEK